MSEFWMFAATVGAGAFVLLSANWFNRMSLRIGLWINGVDRREVDEIIEWNERQR